jgi:hypothetical protein
MLPRVVEAMNILSWNDPDLLRQRSYIDGPDSDVKAYTTASKNLSK